jgi:hypothetical protein
VISRAFSFFLLRNHIINIKKKFPIYRMSDNYEFLKTNEAQDASDCSPYVDKQYTNYINDINNGVYTNNSLTLVNFDLGQIYNSQKFTETSELFAVLPIALVHGSRIFYRYRTCSSYRKIFL